MQDSWLDAPAAAPPSREVFSISRLNREARALLERGLGSVWLEGEISNLSRPGSGHWYFSLKDAAAQVRCAMFRQRNLLVRFPVKDGAQVLARGRVSLYEARGEFQVVIEHLEEAGEGALRRRFEELKQKLQAEGLFDSQHKQPLPALPRRIGVITSPTGAAVRDILHVLRRRFPAIPVLVYPVAVQGEAAPREIVQALGLASARRDCDVLIVARGGGSLEDLWAFNDEAVARAIFACPIPVVSGVGHEVDFTIADFVADERAPTPSAAAERVVPDRAEWLRSLAATYRRMGLAMRRRLGDQRQALLLREQRLARVHPGVVLAPARTTTRRAGGPPAPRGARPPRAGHQPLIHRARTAAARVTRAAGRGVAPAARCRRARPCPRRALQHPGTPPAVRARRARTARRQSARDAGPRLCDRHRRRRQGAAGHRARAAG